MRLIGVGYLLLAASPCLAAPDCGDQPNQTAMNQCADGQHRAADKALNATYGALLAKTAADDRTALQAAQRNWLAYRDAECKFEARGSVGGSIHPFVVSECLTDLTRMQTKRLANQANCAEGDAACGPE